MGQLGFSEMLVIFIVALLVFGPKKLPELGKSLGKGIREFKKATEELKSSWEDQVKDITTPLNEVKQDIHAMGQDMKSDFYKQFEASAETQLPTPAPATTATVTTAAATAAPLSHSTEPAVPKEHV
jgi:sec-independent protein translocase protein TatA